VWESKSDDDEKMVTYSEAELSRLPRNTSAGPQQLPIRQGGAQSIGGVGGGAETGWVSELQRGTTPAKKPVSMN
jgi:hypothetical protein